MAADAIQVGVDAFNELFIIDESVEFVEAPELAGLNEADRKRVCTAMEPFEESRRSAKLRGDQKLYG